MDLDREAADDRVLKAYRRLVIKAHPDKGGHKTKFQSLQAAKETWDSARQQERPASNPAISAGKIVPSGASSSDASGGYRIRSTAVLLTYSGRWDVNVWREFVYALEGRVEHPSGCATLLTRTDVDRVQWPQAFLQSSMAAYHASQRRVWSGSTIPICRWPRDPESPDGPSIPEAPGGPNQPSRRP